MYKYVIFWLWYWMEWSCLLQGCWSGIGFSWRSDLDIVFFSWRSDPNLGQLHPDPHFFQGFDPNSGYFLTAGSRSDFFLRGRIRIRHPALSIPDDISNILTLTSKEKSWRSDLDPDCFFEVGTTMSWRPGPIPVSLEGRIWMRVNSTRIRNPALQGGVDGEMHICCISETT